MRLPRILVAEDERIIALDLCYTVAEYLTAEQVPVIFHTGRYNQAEMADRFPAALACDKPSPPAQILSLLRQALGT